MPDAEMEETKRIMERLVNTPHKMHKDEPRKRVSKEETKNGRDNKE